MNAVTPRWPVRPLDASDDDAWSAITALDSHAFGSTAPASLLESERELHEPGRGIGAYDGATLAGFATAYSFALQVPGARIPAAGISWVGVLPTHRRRGVLSALMTYQLCALKGEAREPVAALWASEPRIYGRFGYGVATRKWSLTVPRATDALDPEAPRDPDLRLRLAPSADWVSTQAVYDAVTATRPGMLARDERWWRRAVQDLPDLRGGSSELRCVVAEDGSGLRGYARYSTTQNFDDSFGQGLVKVREVMANDAAALAALYRFLFDLDLMGRTEVWNVPADDPLLLWLADVRRIGPTLSDAMYIRVVDLPAALSARTYATAVDVVLEVSDSHCPWNAGSWRLTGGPEGARCTRSEDRPVIVMDVRALGAAYLGGTSLLELATAGRVQGEPGSIATLDRAFRHFPAPWCPIVF